jgi:hypothetical protein
LCPNAVNSCGRLHNGCKACIRVASDVPSVMETAALIVPMFMVRIAQCC